MNRFALAFAVLAVGALGLMAFEVLPWVVVETPGFDPRTTQVTYGIMDPAKSRSFLVDVGYLGDPAWVDVRASLGFVEGGLLWGTALAALAALSPIVRPSSRALGEALALAGGGAIVGAAFAAVGLVLFAINVPELHAALEAEHAAATMSPMALFIVGAFVALALILSVAHLGQSLAPARRAFAEVRTMAPAGGLGYSGAPATAASYATPATSYPAPAPAPATALPLPLARDAVLKRIARAREHARAYAARTGSDPAMATWLQQMTGYLDGAERRARMTTDAAALEAIDRDLERHVFSLR